MLPPLTYKPEFHYDKRVRVDEPRPGAMSSPDGVLKRDIAYYRNFFDRVKDNSARDYHSMRLDQGSSKLFVMAGTGIDYRKYFAQSYLIGHLPPNVRNIEDARRYVLKNVAYERDNILFGLDDVWQTGPQTVARGKGDCEDHAILLADMLIRLGYDARVAIGDWDNERHSWVLIAQPNGYLTLVEATEKELSDSPYDWRGRYSPEYMYNDRYIWQLYSNSRSGMHTADWEQVGVFRPA